LLVASAVALASGAMAGRIASRSWDSVVHYRPPFHLPDGERAGTPPLAGRVALVLVDGLRLDASRGMPFLDALRTRGADLASTVGLPSYSRPGRATLATGCWSDLHGATTNEHRLAIEVDNLFRAAGRAGRSCAVAGSAGWAGLFAKDIARCGPAVRESGPREERGRFAQDEPLLARADAEAVAFALRAGADLTVIDDLAPDAAAHARGVRTGAYARALRDADRLIAELTEGFDLEGAAVVVTGDHGHVDAGGHGGAEPEVLQTPLVMAGRGVKAGFRGQARQVDIAPTIAALLGLPLPGAAEGRVLLEALDIDAPTRDALVRAESRQKAAFASACLAVIGEPGGPGAPGARLLAARAAREAAERARRLPVLIGAIVLAFAFVGWLAAIEPARVLAGGAAIGAYELAFRTCLWASGQGLSLSAINYDEELEPYFLRITLFALLALVVALSVVLAAAGLGARRGFAARWRVGLEAVAAIGLLLALPVAAAYWREGLLMSWRTPDVGVMFAAFVRLTELHAVGFGVVLVPLLAWLFARRLHGDGEESMGGPGAKARVAGGA
jgi:hypothetical protein